MAKNINFQIFSGQSGAILTSKMAYFTKKKRATKNMDVTIASVGLF